MFDNIILTNLTILFAIAGFYCVTRFVSQRYFDQKGDSTATVLTIVAIALVSNL